MFDRDPAEQLVVRVRIESAKELSGVHAQLGLNFSAPAEQVVIQLVVPAFIDPHGEGNAEAKEGDAGLDQRR